MKRGAIAFFAGLVFALGLCLSGMTHPSKVLGFLDVTGAWDPSLAFVMAGAVGVAAIAFRLARRWSAPFAGRSFLVPARSGRIDARLLAGAALFGAGWGMSGLCPGPAVTSLASGQIGAVIFVASMAFGMVLFQLALRVSLARAGSESGTPIAPLSQQPSWRRNQ